MSRYVFSLCLIGWATCVGCAGRHKPAPPPAVSASLAHYAGRVLTPSTAQTTVSPTDASPVTIDLLSLPTMPPNVLKPFGASSQLVTGVGTGSAILAVPEAMAKARIDAGSDAKLVYDEATAGSFGSPQSLNTFTGVLAPNVSIRCAISAIQGGKPEFELLLHGPAVAPAALQVGLVARYTTAAATTQPEAGEEGGVRIETAIASVGLASTQSHVAVLVPQGSGSVLAFITVGERGRAPESSLRQARKEIAEAASQPTPLSVEQLVVQSALSAMQSPETRRGAMVSLASQSGAPLCNDMVLSADSQTMEAFAPEAAKALRAAPAGGIGWALDHAAFDYMGRLQIAGKLPPELITVLMIHAGEAGHSPASLEQLVGKTTTRADLENRLVAENYIYLEEVSPSARVRAYDWLKTKDKAPAKYDPMGSPQERQKALDAAIDAMSSTPSTQSVVAGDRQ